ncbi:hypothetical protein [Acidithiobacillus sulfurivorans]|uniref:Uncharacterized protein n=1 Tax=Acidithiobacillus sulfurivorans TaxID=1958756 RepID=A0ABS6A0Z9_9PROT|nr:hypothetical protein [Acidithiobacillus sulfurivorans]MBU2760335.1 hypothetical protein [Acidithiobacillus sulfurivorans]
MTEHRPSNREKWSAIVALLGEIMLLTFVVAILLTLSGALCELVAHFLFGYPWPWEKTHGGDRLLFFTLIATPLLLLAGLAWVTLRDEYQQILRSRMRKW